jgi:hypothetical protein
MEIMTGSFKKELNGKERLKRNENKR